MRHRHYRAVLAAVAVLMILGAGNALAFKWGHGIKGSGDLETRVVEVDDFTKVDLRGAFDVDIVIGRNQELKITIDDNLWDILVAEVSGSTLELGWDENCRPDGDCRIEIVVPRLSAFQLSGAGDVDISDFEGSEFEFNLSGAGDVDMSGHVDELQIRLSGAGSINTRELEAKKVDVKVSGAGNATVFASESIRGRVSGVGNLTYYGDPGDKDTHVSGIGRIRQK